MQRVYILLRNNRQTGPHSLDELVQLGLKPQDLIWVEGKSFGWAYPTEIDALNPHVVDQQPTKEAVKIATSLEESIRDFAVGKTMQYEQGAQRSNKKIHVSFPEKQTKQELNSEELNSDILEKKAEELRKRAQAYSPTTANLNADSFVETKYARSLNSIEEEYTSWVYSKKSSSRKKPFKKHWLISLSVIVIAIGSYYFLRNTESSITTKEKISISEPIQPIEENTESFVQDSTAIKPPVTNQKDISGKPITSKLVTNKNKTSSAKLSQKTILAPTVAQNQRQIEERKGEVVLNSEKPQDETVVKTSSAQKKTLGEKIDGFFEKFKRKEEGELKPTLPGSERKAERRDESTTGSVIDLSQSAALSSNERSSGWMMGIQGLKITLRNSSNYLIQSASAEIRYFDEQNELLETKVVHFSNIPSKKSSTVSAPDHRLADHVDFHLLSATGSE